MFAAGYPPALGEWCIIASVQTASSRGGKFALPDANWVFVDEIHNQAFRWVIEHYRQRGSIVFGFTATPVDLAGVCDKLIVAGTNSELRSCGALVRCKVFSPEQPDLDGVRRLRNREYDPIELRRRFEIVKWEVFANAFKEWRRLNPDEKPTLLWAPGVEESLWFVEQFIGRDVRAEHIDGETPDEKREEIFEGSRSGRIPIVSSCGVLREGVDLPWVVHGILVQVCGRLSTYLQIVGRLLRAYPGKELAILQDHAGAFWRHGSPNQDRDWQLDDTDAKIDQRVSKARREGKIAEPIRCPRCGMERLRGPQCPHCGYKHQRGAREIRMIDGQLKRVTGNLVKCMKQVTPEQRVWTSCLYAAAYSKNGMTLRQAAGLYKQRTGEWPPQGLKNMPEPDSLDWNRAVKHVYPWLTNRKRRTSSGE
jgi:superfamily II DNA or RNA helicase